MGWTRGSVIGQPGVDISQSKHQNARYRGRSAHEPRQNYSAQKQPQVQVVKFGCFAIKDRSLLFLYTAGVHKSLLLGDSCFRGNGVTNRAQIHDIGSHGVPINLVKSDSKNVFCNLTRLICQFIPVLNSLRALPPSRLSQAL